MNGKDCEDREGTLFNFDEPKISRRKILGAIALAAGAICTGPLGVKAAMADTAKEEQPAKTLVPNSKGKDYKFAASLGWTLYDSGGKVRQGYMDAVKEVGGHLTFADANFDPKKQSDQIDDIISSKPDALFITPEDAVAISPAISRAIAGKIPVFAGDSMAPGVPVITTCMSSNFGMGYLTADYIADKLKGKGNVGLVTLPVNESWDQRALGMEYAFRQYPGIKMVAEWKYNPLRKQTPRQGVDDMLTAHKDIDAIWCAWDGGAIEGSLAVQAAGLKNVFLTGIDGGKQSFSYIDAGSPFEMTCAQSFYQMAYLDVYYAHEFLAGRQAPRLVITPTYMVTKESLHGLGEKAADFDRPGPYDAKALGWRRVL